MSLQDRCAAKEAVLILLPDLQELTAAASTVLVSSSTDLATPSLITAPSPRPQSSLPHAEQIQAGSDTNLAISNEKKN